MRRPGPVFLLKLAVQKPHRFFAQGAGVHIHRRQRRAVVFGERHIVETRDGNILRHPHALLCQHVHSRKRLEIVGGNEPVERHAAPQQFFRQYPLISSHELTVHHQAFIKRKTRFPQRFPVSFIPVFGHDDVRRKPDERDVPAAFGKEVELKVPRTEKCEECHGTGAAPGTQPEECPQCHGTGQMQYAQNTPFGRIVNSRTCDSCHGTGKIVKKPCHSCGGKGTKRMNRKINVKIPAGVDQGSRIRVTGGGEAGVRGGENGDLYVYIFVKPHKLFKRDGNEVICDVPVSFVQAALGDTVEVPTLDGKVDLKIPSGIQSGTVLRIKGKGIPYLRSTGRGDQHVRVKVLTPQKLSSKQKELLKEFGELSGENVNPEQKSWKDSVKKFFH